MLVMKMVSFFGFGDPGRRRKHLQIPELYFYSLASGKPIGISQKKFREIPVSLPEASD